MGKVLVSESYLQAIANAIRAKNGSNATYTPAQMGPAITAVPSVKLLYSTDKAANTSNTSNQSLITLTPGSGAWNKAKLIWVTIRDKAGARNGYFYSSDSFFTNYRAKNGSTSSAEGVCLLHNYNNNAFNAYMYASSAAYGVFAYTIASNGNIEIRTRYNRTYSRTINGTYEIKVYAVDFPGTTSFGE